MLVSVKLTHEISRDTQEVILFRSAFQGNGRIEWSPITVQDPADSSARPLYD